MKKRYDLFVDRVEGFVLYAQDLWGAKYQLVYSEAKKTPRVWEFRNLQTDKSVIINAEPLKVMTGNQRKTMVRSAKSLLSELHRLNPKGTYEDAIRDICYGEFPAGLIDSRRRAVDLPLTTCAYPRDIIIGLDNGVYIKAHKFYVSDKRFTNHDELIVPARMALLELLPVAERKGWITTTATIDVGGNIIYMDIWRNRMSCSFKDGDKIVTLYEYTTNWFSRLEVLTSDAIFELFCSLGHDLVSSTWLLEATAGDVI